ncbi:MAG: 2-oxo-tetronate isomerase [Pseudomonadota bacterium]
MPLFAANLSMMFTEYDFLDRFDAAANAGFSAVEYLFPYDFPADVLAEKLQSNNLQQVLFNTVPGDWDAGERGLASLPGREQEFLDGVAKAIEYAKALDCPRIHGMAGLVADDSHRPRQQDTYLKTIADAADLCHAQNIDLLIEPINPINMPGYFLNDFAQACDILDTLNAADHRARLQFDYFHCQRIHGDVPAWIKKCKQHIAHFQIAGTPDRHEPDVGDLPYQSILAAATSEGFEQLAVGCEYIPAGKTEDGLNWCRQWLN